MIKQTTIERLDEYFEQFGTPILVKDSVKVGINFSSASFNIPGFSIQLLDRAGYKTVWAKDRYNKGKVTQFIIEK